MTSIITFGPISGSFNGHGYQLNIPLQTQGDWRKTTEGAQALEDATIAIDKQLGGQLPQNNFYRMAKHGSGDFTNPLR